MPQLGRNSFLGVGRETTYGTAVARTLFYRLVSAGIERQERQEEAPQLYHATTGFVAGAHFGALNEVGGSTRIQMGYEGQGELFAQAFGALPTTTGAGPTYTHTYALGNTLYSSTVHVGKGTSIGGTTQGETFEGMVISRTVMSCDSGGLMLLDLDWIGETSGGQVAQDTATFTANELNVLHSQGLSVTFNAVVYSLRRISVTLDKRLERVHVLGSRDTGQPMPSGPTQVMLECDIRADDWTLLTAQRANTQGNATFSVAGVASRSISWTVHSAYLTEAGASMDGFGVRWVRAIWKGEVSGTSYGLAMVVVNTQSSGVAA